MTRPDTIHDQQPANDAASLGLHGRLYRYEPGNATSYLIAVAAPAPIAGDKPWDHYLLPSDDDGEDTAWERILPGAGPHHLLITIVSPHTDGASYPLEFGRAAGPLHAGYLAEKFPDTATNPADAWPLYQLIASVLRRPLHGFNQTFFNHLPGPLRQRMIEAIGSTDN